MSEVELELRLSGIESATVAAIAKSTDNTTKITEILDELQVLGRHMQLCYDKLSKVEGSIGDAVHMLIDFVKENDIEFLDEEEFTAKVKNLLFGEEYDELPF